VRVAGSIPGGPYMLSVLVRRCVPWGATLDESPVWGLWSEYGTPLAAPGSTGTACAC